MAASTISNVNEGDVLVVRFNIGKILDNTQIDDIGRDLIEASVAASGKKLLLDFRDVTFMSSAMVSKLVTLSNKCKTTGVKLVLCEMSAGVYEIFKITKLTKVFNIQDKKEPALASFAS